jgi:hypothetical protein
MDAPKFEEMPSRDAEVEQASCLLPGAMPHYAARVLPLTTSRAGDLLGPGRPRRSGPESELVDDFAARLNPQVPDGCKCVVLREPRVDSGFPDLVVLIWDSEAATQWPSARRLVDRSDLRLAHLIHTMRGAREDTLSTLLKKRLDDRLARLERAELICRNDGEWRTAPVREAFAIRQILAFEAKMTFSSHVIDQAAANRWFASASYVLLPSWGDQSRLVSDADECGVGIWINGHAKPKLRHRYLDQPMSYASWLFNDWVWRAAGCMDDR